MAWRWGENSVLATVSRFFKQTASTETGNSFQYLTTLGEKADRRFLTMASYLQYLVGVTPEQGVGIQKEGTNWDQR